MKVPIDELEAFPLFLVDPKTDQPASGARLIVETEPEELVLEADRVGQVLIPVRSELFLENPSIRIEPEGVNFLVRLSGGLMVQSSEKPRFRIDSVELLSSHEMNKLGDARVAVFYVEVDSALAREILPELRRTRGVVKTTLGLEPRSWAVMVGGEQQEPGVFYLTVPAPGYDSTWSCFREEWKRGQFLDVNVHEWVETTLTSRLATLYDDPRNRFIGDGLAELVAWRACGLRDNYGDSLSPALLGNRETVDLLADFRVMSGKAFHHRKFEREVEKHGFVPGYALSFAFWHELIENHGADLPSRFVQQIAKKPRVRADEAIAVLEELTGDDTIRNRVRSADVEAARSRIARLVAKPGSRR